MPSDCIEELGCIGTSGVVRDRGRDRALMGLALEGRRGVVALIGDEIDDVVELGAAVLGIVWYVRTGRRSTTDLGARHRRLRMRDRRSSSA